MAEPEAILFEHGICRSTGFRSVWTM